MTTNPAVAHDQLRRWARGTYTSEAATELLIRAHQGTFTTTDRPWIKPTDHGHWIDFDEIPNHVAALSGGEQRLLRIAASIGSTTTQINLGEDVTGLDRPTLRLVLAAIAHAGGSHEQSRLSRDSKGRIAIVREPALQPWATGAPTGGTRSDPTHLATGPGREPRSL